MEDLARRSGAHVMQVPQPAAGDWTTAVVAAIDERTAVVAVPNCHFMTGAVLDLKAMGDTARAAGAMFVADGTQSLGVLPFDVHDIGADLVVAAGYKWLLGPYSVGYMWITPHRRDWRPVEQHWAGRHGSDNFAALTNYIDEHRPGAPPWRCRGGEQLRAVANGGDRSRSRRPLVGAERCRRNRATGRRRGGGGGTPWVGAAFISQGASHREHAGAERGRGTEQ